MLKQKKIKSFLNKINFAIGRNPKVINEGKTVNFIPKGYKAAITISADFELAWAWQWSKVKNPLKLAYDKSANSRLNIPKILNLCEEYRIPITWATVGHLFLDTFRDFENHPTLENFENDFWLFDKDNWFENVPCTDLNTDPYWYAKDLIEKIIDSKNVKHEIGCHTFSHIDCRDNVCSSEVFLSEIKLCQVLAKKYNINLETFVHPAHTIGNLDNLSKLGFTSYRSNNRNVLSFPTKKPNGLWEFEQTSEFIYNENWSIDYHIYRYTEIVNRAITHNKLCYFWLHPSLNPIFVDTILPEIMSYIEKRNSEIWVCTQKEYIDFLNSMNPK